MPAANLTLGRATPAVVGFAATVAAIAIAATPGSGVGALAATAMVLQTTLTAGAAAAFMLLVATGLGCWLQPMLCKTTHTPWAIRVALGLAAALSIWHLAGVLGLLGSIAAWTIALIGLAGLARALARERPRPGARLSRVAILLLAPVAILFAAASSPPGVLWASEYGGYDALTYHLPLAQSWLNHHRVHPVETNVYSYLPSYLESAFAQIGALTLAPQTTEGLLAGTGWRVLACQMLHALITLLAAWLIGLVAARLAPRNHHQAGQLAGHLAAAITLLTPWTIVAGSLAYNDMAVVALAAGALLAALDDGIAPARRGLLAGLLVGAACGVKPTALFLAGPIVAVALLAHAPRAAWPALITAGCLAGLAMLAPWLTRNALAGGNPVFPFATSAFGSAHWSDDQALAFQHAHHASESLPQRLRLALWTDPAAPPQARDVVRFRGLLNPQWGVAFPAAALALLALLLRRDTRRAATTLGLGALLSLAAWLALTHIQSRFLIPLLIVIAPAIALAIASITVPAARHLAAIAAVAPQFVMLLTTWLGQLSGAPNLALPLGPAYFRGDPRFPLEAPDPYQFLSTLERRGRVLLLGDAKALYLTGDVIASSAWDRTPLERAIEREPANPDAWITALRELRVDTLLINLAELDRYQQSGYRPSALAPDAIAPLIDRLDVIKAWPEAGIIVARVPAPSTAP